MSTDFHTVNKHHALHINRFKVNPGMTGSRLIGKLFAIPEGFSYRQIFFTSAKLCSQSKRNMNRLPCRRIRIRSSFCNLILP